MRDAERRAPSRVGLSKGTEPRQHHMYITDQVITEVTPRRVWWTPKGAAGCAARVLARAPDVTGWVMITLTVDRARYASPQDAYESIMRDFPRVNKQLARLNGKPIRWARKLELQNGGWPHWHLICNLRKLARTELPLLDALWQHGMVNITYLRDAQAMRYALKYCCKAVAQDGTEEPYYGLPDWVLDYPTAIRWWQTHAFYEVASVPEDDASGDIDDDDEDGCKGQRIPIRQQIIAKKKMVQVIAYDRFTQMIKWRKTFLLESDARSLMLSVIRSHHKPGAPDLQHLGLQRNINVRLKQCPNEIPVQRLPGLVCISLEN